DASGRLAEGAVGPAAALPAAQGRLGSAEDGPSGAALGEGRVCRPEVVPPADEAGALAPARRRQAVTRGRASGCEGTARQLQEEVARPGPALLRRSRAPSVAETESKTPRT